ncbi:hypothetical protein Enr13x_02260 [Stieleria neptunia]|uniref:Uncharacterized protein n=1 Tax=Stieleria neptunia TaxID=2527979 RepID=A0A518HHX1_9BACT|nr:hypothetical protein [Stieleria neptunia]QDV40420.1 hypothetical protein Enr13x_02260 [Stieleria neptunia]
MTQPNDDGFVSSGHLNRLVGWTTLLIGLALSAALDPWLLDATPAADSDNGVRLAVRHAHGVVIAMAFLQLAMAHLLATPAFHRRERQIAAFLTTIGAGSYIAGYVVALGWPAAQWLVLVGSLVNFSGFALLWRTGPSGVYAPQIKMILPVACFGMLLDFVAGLLPVLPAPWVLDYLGSDDGVRLRMLRLARVAAIALSVLTLLFYGIARHGTADRARMRLGGTSLALGAVGMPLILAAACFTTLQVKYLLPLPATAVVTGVIIGLVIALKAGGMLERWGWFLIAASTSVGMLIGLYAFEGPFPTPGFMGDYNALPRRLTRLAHSYCIVLGMLSIFLSRETRGAGERKNLAKIAASVFIAGCVVSLAVLLLHTVISPLPTAFSVGPLLVLIGAAGCLAGRASPAKLAN